MNRKRSAKVVLSPDRLQAGSPEKQKYQPEKGFRCADKFASKKSRVHTNRFHSCQINVLLG